MKQLPSQQEIERFLAVKPNNKDTGYGDGESSGEGYDNGIGYGDGYGSGKGNGFCNGYGFREGYGEVYGNGAGNINGKGYCFDYGNYCFDYGNGFGTDGRADNKDITFINGYRVYIIDCLPTLIYQIRDNYAKGAILNSDLTLTPCFIARVDNCFAHGETLHEAVQDAQAKALNHAPVETRIQRFVQKYPDPDKPVPFAELFDWHHALTGSCRFGREKFVEQHQLDTNAEYTPRFFINLTKNDFGGEIIRKLTKAYNL